MTMHLVLGGAGFLGRHVVRSLLMRGDEVTVADRTYFPALCDLPPPKVVMIDLARATGSELDDLVSSADVIHNYAWSTIPQTANADPLADLVGNVGLVIKLLEAVRRRGGGRIIFSSSGGTVYGRLRSVPVPETHALAPLTAYGASKVSAETYLNYYRELYGLDTRVARIANPYGAGQRIERLQGVVTTIVHRALSGDSIEIWGDGEAIRDFIHISDATNALLSIADALESTDRSPFLFNIGSGTGSSINHILAIIERRLERKIAVLHRPGRLFDVPISVLDISKIKQAFAWRPEFSLETGISEMFDDLEEDPARLFSSRVRLSDRTG
tara:strand:- start:29456 stop:30439 length:984 start_codon:yes stop_codon:yes gene_type:complete